MAERGELDGERAAIVTACRRLAAGGLVVGTAGNVSVRRGNSVAVTASGARFDAMSEAEVVVVDTQGRLVGGGLQPTSEL